MIVPQDYYTIATIISIKIGSEFLWLGNSCGCLLPLATIFSVSSQSSYYHCHGNDTAFSALHIDIVMLLLVLLAHFSLWPYTYMKYLQTCLFSCQPICKKYCEIIFLWAQKFVVQWWWTCSLIILEYVDIQIKHTITKLNQHFFTILNLWIVLPAKYT